MGPFGEAIVVLVEVFFGLPFWVPVKFVNVLPPVVIDMELLASLWWHNGGLLRCLLGVPIMVLLEVHIVVHVQVCNVEF